MPPLTDEQTRRNVIRQWISGYSRDRIAEQNGIGAGTVSSIVANYKVGLEELDFDSVRQLAVEARQHGWNFADLASHVRLNFFNIDKIRCQWVDGILQILSAEEYHRPDCIVTCHFIIVIIILPSYDILLHIFDTPERMTYNVPYAVDVFRILQHMLHKYQHTSYRFFYINTIS
jgi:DNA-binding CsgD family transcriptional regulator